VGGDGLGAQLLCCGLCDLLYWAEDGLGCGRVSLGSPENLCLLMGFLYFPSCAIFFSLFLFYNLLIVMHI
jgi:hypothetical protein